MATITDTFTIFGSSQTNSGMPGAIITGPNGETVPQPASDKVMVTFRHQDGRSFASTIDEADAASFITGKTVTVTVTPN